MVTFHSFPEGSPKNHPLAQLAPVAPESTALNTTLKLSRGQEVCGVLGI